MVIELLMVNVGVTAATHNNGEYGNKVSLACIASCFAICLPSEELLPVCMAACMLNCSSPVPVSPAVTNCACTCAQSVCSKYVGSDAKILGQCVADECVDKCLPGA
ncbi:hypothetical protein POM88_048687 [Heracleum sosnowskyi]|uniref:Uncharacterized protein n=1 Tax=Heracleum sosnowskyi TaxID=360622 RepID=A0AAD8GVP8_9APIA|nr:hypothetical protein POM88_048687 [Heracleum sosnowskyi]